MSERRRFAESGGLWALGPDGPVRVGEGGGPGGALLVPSEKVLMLAVDLPLPNRRARAAALPFAIEDQVAEPLALLHTALGAELSPQRHLAGVVRHADMLEWLARADPAGLPRCALVPDALVLPEPPADGWTVELVGERVLVRTFGGPAFATTAALLPAAWRAAGEPRLRSVGEALPAELSLATPEEDAFPALAARGAAAALLDLRQGLYAVRPPYLALRRLAGVVAVGFALHAAIMLIDTLALRQMADNRREELVAVVRQFAPSVRTDGDIAAELAPLLERPAGVAQSSFFPLMRRTAAALSPLTASVSLQGVRYVESERSLTLEVEAADIAGLQRVGTALSAARLNPVTGSAAAQNGRADGVIVVRDRGAGA